MSVSSAITLAIAILGAVLGLLNTWNGINDRRVRLKVTPKWSLAPGFQGLAIEVVNLSAFPVTISEIGFTIGRSRGALPKRTAAMHQMVDGPQFPVRLERHHSFNATFIADGLGRLDVRRAYALTTSGVIVKGNSPALRQYVRDHHS